MKEVKYKETQTLYWFIVFFSVLTILIMLSTFFEWGNNPIPSWSAGGLLAGLLFFPIVIFFNMTISIDTKMASVKFGIGLIKRQIPVNDLDLSTAEIVHLPWYAGIGYRISLNGTFFNTKPGPALLIKTKNRNTEFFVGTKHGKEIIAIIEEIQKQENVKA